MIIQKTTAQPVIPPADPPARKARQAAPAKSAGDQASISQAARESRVYDFTNMSPKEMLETINGLIKSGRMTVDETSSLIALIPISVNGGPAPEAAGEKMNFFAALERMTVFNRSIQNEAGVLYAQKAVSALKRFQA